MYYPAKDFGPLTIMGQISYQRSFALQVSVGLVRVEGDKNIEGLVKVKIQVKTFGQE